ncbi:transmembrane and TPR repeat-containing protein 4 [Candidatus Omnitrophus magneticus]|uniref:Transmembrane and TPR repeat-containing protein 4 n=1 Tax=Candidatus Omnitrophus magneticus TaxID=1609969 RepID=A0A0F0CUS7_9BACT|nr:transmembrane and TPR repeat-containing protein 4 [Candidatus Omnitrophus magneticus]
MKNNNPIAKNKKYTVIQSNENTSAPARKNKLFSIFKQILPALIIFGLTFFVYSNTLKSDFIWDDEYLILNNSQIKNFQHFPNIFKTYVGYGSENINNFYRPMQELSNMIDYSIWGAHPFGFHLTNVILHSLTALMVFILIKLISRNTLAAFFAACFFGIHPVHTEAVAYIAGRADSLYSFFFLLSLTLFIKSVTSSKEKPISSFFIYSASFLFFVISLLSKEMVIIMPLLCFLYLFYFHKKTDTHFLYGKNLWKCVPYAIIVVIYGVLRATLLSFSDIAPASAFEKLPLIFRLFTFFRTVGIYFRLLILPTDLHMERSVPTTRNIFDIEAILCLLMICGIIWIAYKTFSRGNKFISFSITWFFVNLLPVSNIVPINSFLAEHWIYMACIGPLTLAGLGLSWLWKNIPKEGRSLRIAFILFVSVLIYSYSNGTIERNKDWKDEISFFSSTLKYNPRNARLYLNLGNTFFEKGDIDNAIAQYKKAIGIHKDYAVAYGNIGSAYLNKNDVANAQEYLEQAIKLKFNYPIAHYNLGIIYYNKNKFSEAINELNTATKQLPQLYQAWNMKGRTYLKIGQIPEAKEAFNTSLQIFPDQPPIKKALSKISELKNFSDSPDFLETKNNNPLNKSLQ